MTIRGQLIISNMAMLVVPILLAVLVNALLLSYLQENSLLTVPDIIRDVNPTIKEHRARPLREVLQKAQHLHREVNILTLKNPDSLNTSEALDRLTGELAPYFGGLVVRKGDTIVYKSPLFSSLDTQDLPPYGTLGMKEYNHKTADRHVHILAQEDFRFTDKTEGTVFILWNLNPWDREFATFNTLLILTFVLFSLGVNFGLTWIFSRRLMKPVRLLRQAFSAIEHGDLSTNVIYSSKDETLPLFKAFEGMRQKLLENKGLRDRYEANRREMIARIAHDLRTPITAINGYTQGILEGVADTEEKRRRYLTVIAAKARDLSQMADELFLFSSLDIKAVPYDFHPLELNTFLGDLWPEILLDYADRGMTGEAPRLTDKPVWVNADAGKIRKVITNLADNAVKYKKPGQEVRWEWTLEAECDWSQGPLGGFAVFKAKDNGRGIGPEALPLIFERFYREDSARSSATAGTGLGLAIVRHIAEDHGGTVEAVSTLGQGTELILKLPLIEPPQEKKQL